MTVTIKIEDEEERKQLTEMAESFGTLLNTFMTYTGLIAVLRRNEPQFILGDSEYQLLDKICLIYNSCSADYVNIGYEVHKSITKQIVPSDVPKFIDLLRANHLYQYIDIAEDLFRYWCSQDPAYMNSEILDLMEKTGTCLDWLHVWHWLNNNQSNNDTEVHAEMTQYDEAIVKWRIEWEQIKKGVSNG